MANMPLTETLSLLEYSERLAHVGSFRIDLEDHSIEWSDEMFRIHGLDRSAFTPAIGANREKIHLRDRAAWDGALKEAAEADEIVIREQRILRPDDTVRYVIIYLKREPHRKGRCIAGTMQDITDIKHREMERNKMESKLQQAQKLDCLGVLAGGIAHDFNNLLMGILGNADLALMDLAPESPARQSILAIETAAKKAAELSRQMLAYSGRGKFTVKRLGLPKLVQEMVHLLRTSISKKAVLKLELTNDIPPIEADAAQIRQVLLNLVLNASEAIESVSGVISIRTGALDCDRQYLKETFLADDLKEGTYSYIEISDTGMGMDRQTIARVFDPFFTTKFTGRGLGLAAVLGIVRGHGGAINVYSEPGRGTTVKLLFPAVTAPVSSSDPLMDFQVNDRFKEKRVLLVDDEETVRTVGKAMLKRLGCHVVTAEDGEKAVGIFQKTPDYFDCVILDLTMPRMDGEECYRSLRRIRPDIAVIISSGYNEQDLVDRFAGKGLAGFIQKPYKTAKLSEVLGFVFQKLDGTL